MLYMHIRTTERRGFVTAIRTVQCEVTDSVCADTLATVTAELVHVTLLQYWGRGFRVVSSVTLLFSNHL